MVLACTLCIITRRKGLPIFLPTTFITLIFCPGYYYDFYCIGEKFFYHILLHYKVAGLGENFPVLKSSRVWYHRHVKIFKNVTFISE